jgi:hypothetical protein
MVARGQFRYVHVDILGSIHLAVYWSRPLWPSTYVLGLDIMQWVLFGGYYLARSKVTEVAQVPLCVACVWPFWPQEVLRWGTPGIWHP